VVAIAERLGIQLQPIIDKVASYAQAQEERVTRLETAVMKLIEIQTGEGSPESSLATSGRVIQQPVILSSPQQAGGKAAPSNVAGIMQLVASLGPSIAKALSAPDTSPMNELAMAFMKQSMTNALASQQSNVNINRLVENLLTKQLAKAERSEL